MNVMQPYQHACMVSLLNYLYLQYVDWSLEALQLTDQAVIILVWSDQCCSRPTTIDPLREVKFLTDLVGLLNIVTGHNELAGLIFTN